LPRAILAVAPVLEAGGELAAAEPVQRRQRGGLIIGMDERQEGLRQHLFRTVPEGGAEGGVQPLEGTVHARDAEELERQIEETVVTVAARCHVPPARQFWQKYRRNILHEA